MRQVLVFKNDVLAGTLTEDNGFNFQYDERFLVDPLNTAISLTLPKKQHQYRSDHLFPFFFNMLSEGLNKKVQCRHLKIDENDFFGLLIATAQFDTIGSITLKPFGQDK